MAIRWLSLSSSLARAQPGVLLLTPTRHFAGRVFTGRRADVRTDKSPDDVATDSGRCVRMRALRGNATAGSTCRNIPRLARRHWMAGDDLGMRVEAATGPSNGSSTAAADKAATSRGSKKQPEAGAEEAMAAGELEDACHPADPYSAVGEEPPRPDDFHEEDDGTIPPSSGFPA